MDGREESKFKNKKGTLVLIVTTILCYSRASLKLLAFLIITVCLVPPYFFGKVVKELKPAVEFDFFVKRVWSTLGLWFCRINVEVYGKNFQTADVYVSNHVSWLDILVFNKILDLSFIAKAEVKGWFGLGFLARLADTVFVDRKVMAAKKQQIDLANALNSRKKICFFPEGTSSNGSTVLPFKSSLFESFVNFRKSNRLGVLIQPVTLVYKHSDQKNPFIYGWWGEMSLIPHIFDVLANSKTGTVRVIFHKKIDNVIGMNRKALSAASEKTISSALKT